MAQRDWRDTGLAAEEKLANLVLHRRSLSPPVDVHNLAGELADVQEMDFPVLADALVIRRPYNHERPLILLNRKATTRRERVRFTIAHEVGHILIPYHPGWIACNVDAASPEDRNTIGDIESGANLFASELLMPSSWVKGIVSEEISIKDMFHRVVDEAEVSYTAARIKLTKCLPPDCVCIESGAMDEIKRFDVSPGTSLLNLVTDYQYRTEPQLLYKKLDRSSSQSCIIQRGYREVRFWKLDLNRNLPAVTDARRSSDILRQILDETIGASPFRSSITASLNGKCGASNREKTAESVEKIYGILKTRFERRDIRFDDKSSSIVDHPEFDSFLVSKAREMFAKWQKKSR